MCSYSTDIYQHAAPSLASCLRSRLSATGFLSVDEQRKAEQLVKHATCTLTHTLKTFKCFYGVSSTRLNCIKVEPLRLANSKRVVAFAK